MAIDYTALATELTAGHPDTGVYSATDSIARDELNAPNRPTTGAIDDLIDYMLYEKYRTAPPEGTAVKLYGRCRQLARAVEGVDVFGDGTLATYHSIGAAESMLRILDTGSDNGTPVDLGDSRFDEILNGLVSGEVMGAADRTAITALKDNKQSRAQELGFGRVRTGDVEFARNL